MGRITASKVLLLVITLALIGILNVFTLWALRANWLAQQFFWLAGFSLLLISFFWHPSLVSWRKFDWLLYLGVIALLILPLFEPAVRGSHRWLQFGIFSFQPSELAKPLFILALTSLVEKRERWRWGIITILALPVVILLFIEPDFGSALLYLSLAVFLAFLSYWPRKEFWGVIFLALLGLFLVLPRLLSPYQKERWATFLHPGRDPLGAGYNTLQAKISIGSGRWLGQGFWHLHQNLQFLPEAHTDFIFASWANAAGWSGVAFLLILYSFLFWLLGQRVLLAKNAWQFYFRFLLLFQLWLQTLVNLGMNLGILPVTGLPLPFFSYGGSSLLTSFLTLAFILL